MHSTTEMNTRSNSAWRSPWVISWVGLIVAVLGVNLFMVYLAISTNPGLVNEDYYERGQHYEKTLASRLAKDPGWTMRADFPRDIELNVPTSVRVFLVDNAGQPVTPDSVRFYAYRGSDKSKDFFVDMEAEGKGRYVANVSFPLFGFWDGLIAVQQGEDEYTTGDRIIVARPQ